jgi:hypothetical protein
MKKWYTVTAAFWHGGLLLEVGARVRLSNAEAKYRTHAIEPEKPKTADKPAEKKPEPAPKVVTDGAKS